ncbi:MAG: PfkB family carbohydrate kinase [Pirellulales bacterium]|nr:PfkB family carbohydrate kinase [Pirellulales bacterium]
MPLLVVGSIAFDSVETPTERRDDILGGSAVHFSYAASFFTKLKMVGVVGEDWPEKHTELLQARGIDTSGIQTVPGGKTFRWTGKYHPNMNDRETLEVHLNVLESFQAELSPEQRASKFVYLGNDSPQNQMRVLEQVDHPELVVADTMDLWINIQNDELKALLKKVDGLVLNDSEAKLLVDDENVIRAGERILALGPRFVVIKKGEHGALFFGRDQRFVLPAYPTPHVVDPTGAGDSFAGGMMGYLAEKHQSDPQTLKEALAYGSVVASFNVEDFSLDRMQQIDRRKIDERFAELRQMLSF